MSTSAAVGHPFISGLMIRGMLMAMLNYGCRSWCPSRL